MIDNRANEMAGEQGIVPVSGEWWVRKECIAMARGAFRHPVSPPSSRGWRKAMGAWKMQQRLFQLRHGAGMIMCGSMVPVIVEITPDKPLQVRMSRLFAFEPGLEFRTRLVRRVPMSGAGAWQSAILSGSGKIIMGCVGQPSLYELSAEDCADTEFAPEAVVAWSPAVEPKFALPKLTLAAFLLPSGVRQVRMAFQAETTLWLDGGSWGNGLSPNTAGSMRPAPKQTPPFG